MAFILWPKAIWQFSYEWASYFSHIFSKCCCLFTFGRVPTKDLYQILSKLGALLTPSLAQVYFCKDLLCVCYHIAAADLLQLCSVQVKVPFHSTVKRFLANYHPALIISNMSSNGIHKTARIAPKTPKIPKLLLLKHKNSKNSKFALKNIQTLLRIFQKFQKIPNIQNLSSKNLNKTDAK